MFGFATLLPAQSGTSSSASAITRSLTYPPKP